MKRTTPLHLEYTDTIIWTFQVVQGLDATTLCVDDIDEWLQIINVKLRHMREDIEGLEKVQAWSQMHSKKWKELRDAFVASLEV